MCMVVLYSFVCINSVALSITNAYRTNSALAEFKSALSEVESNMEKYVAFKTFNDIEAYYSSRGRLDSLAVDFNTTLSPDEILLKEYKVKKLMESFLECADKAIYARRGNNVDSYVTSYRDALRVYGYLSDSVNELNALYFQRNIRGYTSIIHDMKLIEFLSVLLLATVVGVNFFLAYILINRITSPLMELSRVANELASGNFDVDLIGIESGNEVGNICRAFDRMTVSIREYIETIRSKAQVESRLRQQELETRELYKDAQLKTLQAQINPHFLFNTLNAGAQLAMMEGADDTCTFIEKTADFFRYNIQNMDKEVFLSDEIELVDNYMYIMRVRFADRVRYEKDIRCDDLKVRMPSMVLQPLVENSIKHGIGDMKSGGTISLRVFRDGGILNVEIADNGVGMDAEKRGRLLHGAYFYEDNSVDRSKTPSVGIGMINVITRLRMFFDDNRIFDIRPNDPEPGTTFAIRIRDV